MIYITGFFMIINGYITYISYNKNIFNFTLNLIAALINTLMFFTLLIGAFYVGH